MEIEIQLTREPIDDSAIQRLNDSASSGAWLEFRGVVRGEENGDAISALEYEAYSPMAENEMRRIVEMLGNKFPCLAVKIIHRIGIIPVGETAIYVGIAAKHRGEAISLLAEFMNRLKQEVPIWKARAIVAAVRDRQAPSAKSKDSVHRAPLQFSEAISEINLRCATLPAVRASFEESFGRVLREDVFATEDLPATDKSTRDGYAILQNDNSEIFRIVDTLHAADWKPQQLKTGEAVRIATGGNLPCDNLRVVMQENVQRDGDKFRIVKSDANPNIRKRGEEMRAGEIILRAGKQLDAGSLALLATIGNVKPLISPKLRVVHFTTGDEIIPPDQKPKPGQIRDSNSILIRTLLKKFQCDVWHKHLPENFDEAKRLIATFNLQLSTCNLLLVSGGASVGEKDFTRELLEHLGFETVFNRIAIRPGAPLIFGVDRGASASASRIAFGLPGNPLSHFVCFQLFVAIALAKLIGAEPQQFSRGILSSKLEDAPNPRETFWPANGKMENGRWELTPLRWNSSGDVTCLKEANALIRVPANRGAIDAGAEVEFLPTI